MQLPTENNNIRLLHADAASPVVSAWQIVYYIDIW